MSDQISRKGLKDHVVFISHSFLSFEEIILIWKQMDVGLQVAAHDALSTSLMEPMLFQKELVCTSIYPYRKLESTFELDMGLVDLEVNQIMRRMEELIDGKKTNTIELMNRKKVIVENFNFERNTESTLEYFLQLS